MVTHERLTEPRVTIEWLHAKSRSLSNLTAFLDLNGIKKKFLFFFGSRNVTRNLVVINTMTLSDLDWPRFVIISWADVWGIIVTYYLTNFDNNRNLALIDLFKYQWPQDFSWPQKIMKTGFPERRWSDFFKNLSDPVIREINKNHANDHNCISDHQSQAMKNSPPWLCILFEVWNFFKIIWNQISFDHPLEKNRKFSTHFL